MLAAGLAAQPAAAGPSQDRAARKATAKVGNALSKVPRRNMEASTRKRLLRASRAATRSARRKRACPAARSLEALRPQLRSRTSYREGRYPRKLSRRLDRAAAVAVRALVRTGRTRSCVIVGEHATALARENSAPEVIPPDATAEDLEEGESTAEEGLQPTPGAQQVKETASTPVITGAGAPQQTRTSFARPFAQAAQSSLRPFEVVRSNDAGSPPGNSFPQDLQVADGGGVTMISGNNGGMVSVDAGQTFAPLNSWTVFGDFEGGFDGDTVLRYSAAIDRFIWLIQGGLDATGTNNRYALAVARPGDLRAAVQSGQPLEGVWSVFDLTRDMFNEHQTSFDYPHMGLGNGYLFLTWNRDGRGVVNARAALGQLQTGRIGFTYWRENRATFRRVAQQSGNRGIFVRNDTLSRAVAGIVENGSSNLVEYGLRHWEIPTRDWTSLTPLGEDWTNRVAGEAVKAATVRDDQLWVGWTAARGYPAETQNRFAHPHVQYAVYRLPRTGPPPGDLELLQQGNVFNAGVAIVDPSFGTSSEGDVAMNASYGGPDNAPAPLVGYLTGDDRTLYSWFRADPTTAGGDRSQGDYGVVSPSFPNTREMVASGYSTWVVDGTPEIHYGFIRFRRGIASVPQSTAMVLSCPSSVTVGTPTTLTGALTPALAGVPVAMEYKLADQIIRRALTTDGRGRFSDRAPFNTVGTWTVRASYAGDARRRGAEATCTVQVTAPPQNPPPNQPQQTSLTLTCPANGGFVGDQVSVSGALTPAMGGATISLRYQPTGAEPETRTVSTDAQGRYEDSYTTRRSGNLTIQANFAGNAEFNPSQSPACTIYVQPVPDRGG
jgi:hypothetical protein